MLNIKRRCPQHPYNPLPESAEMCQVCLGEQNAELDRKTPRKPTFKRGRRKKKAFELPEETAPTSSKDDMDEVLRIVNR